MQKASLGQLGLCQASPEQLVSLEYFPHINQSKHTPALVGSELL